MRIGGFGAHLLAAGRRRLQNNSARIATPATNVNWRRLQIYSAGGLLGLSVPVGYQMLAGENSERSALESSESSLLRELASYAASQDPFDRLNEQLKDIFGGPPGQSVGGPPPIPSPGRPQYPGSGSPLNRLSEGRETAAKIAAMNAAVYAGWWLAPEAFMNTWFTTSSIHMLRGWHGALTALTSSFSHRELWHFGLNMIGLWSFAPRLMDGRSTVQAPKLSVPEFWAFYVASGWLSGMASNAFSVAVRSPIPSLGASGSLFAVLSYYTLSHPDSRILLFFFINTDAMTALGASTVMNAYFVAKAFRAARLGTAPPMFDGMAHLAGTAIGVAWYKWAQGREERRRQEQRRGIW